MDPVLRIVVGIVGALIGASLARPGGGIEGAFLGAILCVGVLELRALLMRLQSLEEDLQRLRAELHRAPEIRQASPPPPARELAVRRDPDIARDAVDENAAEPPEAGEGGKEGEQPETVESPPGRWATDAPIETPAPAAHVPHRQPPERAPIDSPVLDMLRRFFTEGNALVRVGVVILFFGVAFLLSYMAQHSHFPIELRLCAVAVGGIALLGLGWRLRSRRAGYSLALEGGAVGILYLTVFAALRLYALLPAAVAFPLLVAIAGLSAALAVLQNSQSFALLAVTGGFLAPVLASSGEGNHVVLFSYYAVLNAGILAVAWFKAWRPLNIAGFVFTFAIGTAWGILRYRPEAFASTEPFLILFFLFYLGIAILFTHRQPPNLLGYVDGTLVFGTPIVVFALQSSMLHHQPMSLAYSAVAMSAVYLACAKIVHRRREAQPLLVEALIAIGVVFLTLAVPLALDARWSAAAWALEGAALVWVGCRQDRVLPRLSGALLSAASGCIIANQWQLGGVRGALALADYFGAVLLSVAAVGSAHFLNAHRSRLRSFETWLPAGLFAWGYCWWSFSGVSEIQAHWPDHALAWGLIFWSFTSLACSLFYQVTTLQAAKVGALLQLPAMLVAAAISAGTQAHPSVGGGWLAWPLAFAAMYALMYAHEGPARGGLANLANAAVAWLLCAIGSWEAAWAIDEAVAGSHTWRAIAWVLIPLALLYWMPRLVTRVSWPFVKNREAYLLIVGVGLASYLGLWSLTTNATLPGDMAPLPYCPFLNPLDIAQAFTLLVLYRYYRFLRAVRSPEFARIDGRIPLPVLVGLAFVWLNAVLLRTLHQWLRIPFGIDAMLGSTLVETSLSIFWATLAMVTMLIATRRRRRGMWLVGAALLAVVIAKLFLVDLASIGSIARIISFVGVGVLMLVIGYHSPIPPAEASHP